MVVHEHPLPELPDVPAYGVGGSPGFIALIALHGAFGPPPIVVLSGINRGANAGRAVLHSGTVGAAFTAAANGCRAMAVSLDVLSAGEATAASGGAAVAAAGPGTRRGAALDHRRPGGPGPAAPADRRRRRRACSTSTRPTCRTGGCAGCGGHAWPASARCR